MPINGMVRRYLDNLSCYLCLQTSAREADSQILHLVVFPLSQSPHQHVYKKEFEQARSFSVRSVSSKLLLDKNCTSRSFMQFRQSF